MVSLRKVTSIAAGTAVLTLGVLGANAARAGITVLDFDTGNSLLPPGSGQAVDGAGLFTDFGISIGTTNSINNPLLLFNSNCGVDFPGVPCSGDDNDLASGPSFGTQPQGNVLIIHSDLSPISDPNDFGDGGIFEFSFTDPGGVTFNSVRILALDELPEVPGGMEWERNELLDMGFPVFTFFFEGNPTGQEIEADSINLLGTEIGDNSLREFDFTGLGLTNVTRVDMEFAFTGAIASLNYEQEDVPEPTLTTGLLALGLLGILKRKRSGN